MHLVSHGIQQFSEAAVLLTRAGHSPGDIGFLEFIQTDTRPMKRRGLLLSLLLVACPRSPGRAGGTDTDRLALPLGDRCRRRVHSYADPRASP